MSCKAKRQYLLTLQDTVFWLCVVVQLFTLFWCLWHTGIRRYRPWRVRSSSRSSWETLDRNLTMNSGTVGRRNTSLSACWSMNIWTERTMVYLKKQRPRQETNLNLGQKNLPDNTLRLKNKGSWTKTVTINFLDRPKKRKAALLLNYLVQITWTWTLLMTMVRQHYIFSNLQAQYSYWVSPWTTHISTTVWGRTYSLTITRCWSSHTETTNRKNKSDSVWWQQFS